MDEVIGLLNLIDEKITSIFPKPDCVFSKSEVNLHSDYIAAFSDIREMLRSTVTLAGSISETNIECMLHIIKLKRERTEIEKNHVDQLEVLQSYHEAFNH